MPYWRMYCHLIWATKNREPVLIGKVANTVEASLRSKIEEMRLLLHALFLMPGHVHLAVSIPTTLSVATVVSQLKGSSSHLVNHTATPNDPIFSWQSEYGAVSFGEKQLPDVIAYIKNQPERHSTNRLWSPIERFSE